MTTTALRDHRAKLLTDMRAILDTAERAGRGVTAEERDRLQRYNLDIDSLKLRIDAMEQGERTLRDAAGPRPTDPKQAVYVRALQAYLSRGFARLTGGEQRVLQTGHQTFDERGMSTGSGPAGGFVVPPDTSLYGTIIEAQKFFSGVEQAGATVLRTDSGADLPMPTDDDTANVGAIVNEEGSHAGGTDVTLGQRILRAYLYSSKVVKVSWQLLQDAPLTWEPVLGRKLGVRLARIQNQHFTTGIGASQPQGLVTGATEGIVAATGNTAAIPADDIIRLYHSVDVAYRTPTAGFMMHDNTALAVRLLKDSSNQYLWQPGLTQGAPDRLVGQPVRVNNDMATMAASAKSILFGDYANYHVRKVRGIFIVRLNERYAENAQVGFLAFERADGLLVDAGQHPVKYFQNSAS